MKNVIFTYNPLSGEGGIATYLDQIIHIYQRNGYVVTPLRIMRETGFKPLVNLVGQLSPVHILIAGGDGSVNRLINFMRQNSIDTPIAILPTGTANDFASTISMPQDPIKALKSIITGHEHSIDLGRVGDKFFVNVLSCGLMCDVSQRTPTLMKNTFGKVAYYFSSLSELPNFRRIKIRVESDELSFTGQCLLVMIFNGRSAGTLKMAQSASITDGVLDVLIIKGNNIVYTIGTLFHFLMQRRGNYPEDVVYFRTNRLKVHIDGENVATDIDGEAGGKFPLDVECLPGGLKVIVPADFNLLRKHDKPQPTDSWPAPEQSEKLQH